MHPWRHWRRFWRRNMGCSLRAPWSAPSDSLRISLTRPGLARRLGPQLHERIVRICHKHVHAGNLASVLPKGDESASCAQSRQVCLRQRTTQNDGGLSYRVRNFWLGARYFPRIPHGRPHKHGHIWPHRAPARRGYHCPFHHMVDMHRAKTSELHFPLAHRNSLGCRRDAPAFHAARRSRPIRHRYREYRRHAYACRYLGDHARHFSAQLRQSACDFRLCMGRARFGTRSWTRGNYCARSHGHCKHSGKCDYRHHRIRARYEHGIASFRRASPNKAPIRYGR